ncbi:hypothetical protein [Streptomyces sp. NBC_00986]|uniref:hypothetical protein n=1 Tax=Streptomyces sp. NBC_00986 TaxID=2903702 RepID=UPI0038657B51|nr:hypothetical protein OG504_18410 [Streptomyces sp. NBC_00986]
MDAELRADGLGSSRAILVVEGPDDKRVFARHVLDPAQILPAGGRKLLLSAHEKANVHQRAKIVFVTDCDYEVRRGALHGSPDLIITTLTDMESDLIALGLVEPLVLELVPQALESQAVCHSICVSVLAKAKKISIPLGRLRMAAQPLGIPLDLDDVKISRYWNSKTASMNFARLVDAMHSKVSDVVSFNDWRALVAESPDDMGMCHGKDLLRSVAYVLKSEYRVADMTSDLLARLMRAHLTGDYLEKWDVIRRIKTWQQASQRYVLLA